MTCATPKYKPHAHPIGTRIYLNQNTNGAAVKSKGNRMHNALERGRKARLKLRITRVGFHFSSHHPTTTSRVGLFAPAWDLLHLLCTPTLQISGRLCVAALVAEEKLRVESACHVLLNTGFSKRGPGPTHIAHPRVRPLLRPDSMFKSTLRWCSRGPSRAHKGLSD